jgi:hypothetical protein
VSSDSFSSVDEVGRVLRNEVLVVLTDMHSHRLDQSIKIYLPHKNRLCNKRTFKVLERRSLRGKAIMFGVE